MRPCAEHDDLGCPMTRINRVDGQGPVPCDIMLIGEAPGKTEDRKGIPFCGKSGSELTHLYLGKCASVARENVYITNLVKCLDGASSIKTTAGWKRINYIYRHRSSNFSVYCVDGDGIIRTGRVLNATRALLGNRKLYRVSPAFGKKSPRGLVGATFTEDHLLLTTFGWKRVDELAPSDRVHKGAYRPSNRTMGVFAGMLLGDSHLDRGSSAVTTTHSINQLDYLEYKQSLVGGDEIKVREITVREKPYIIAKSRNSDFRVWFREFYGNVYPTGVKQITHELLSYFTLESLAILFMDDGYMRFQPTRAPQAEIAVCAFSVDSIKRLVTQINLLGVNCYAITSRKYPRIYFGKDGSKQLSTAIAPYVPACMEYKLLTEHRGGVKIAQIVGTTPLYSKVTVTPTDAKSKWVYDIEVEKYHNFITHAGVAHNCRTNEKDRDPSAGEWGACSHLLTAELHAGKPRFVGSIGSFATQWFWGLSGGCAMEKVHGFGYQHPLGFLVMPLYHPAFGLHSTAMMRHIMEDFERFGKMVRGDESVMWRARI